MADSGRRTVKEQKQNVEAERSEAVAQPELDSDSDSDSDSCSVPSPSAVRRPPFTTSALPSAVRRPPSALSSTVVRRPPITQLRWRCRRGMRELDIVLERYLEQRYACASAVEQQAFEALLDLPDPQLFAYLMRRETPTDTGWVNVIAKLAASNS